MSISVSDNLGCVTERSSIEQSISSFIAKTRYEDLPAEAIKKTKTFLLDSIGVGLAGTSDPNAARVLAAAERWGTGDEATAWGSGAKLPAPSAAFANAYLIHCLEYDCIHERAVMHPMATLLPALMAWCERAAQQGKPANGKRFLNAIAVGVDISGLIGSATKSGLRFFRPATAGGFGAAAAIASVAGWGDDQVRNTLAIHCGQVSGTMQAHMEGSPTLGLQIGFNSRAAVVANDLAAAGLTGPRDFLTGQFGFFSLFENGSFDPKVIENELGRVWQITQLSHKPFPSGRLSHGGVDGLRRLMTEHGFPAEAVAEVTVHVPPLVMRLMGRPLAENPTANHAKLCLPFVMGTYLARGRVDVPDFGSAEMLNDPAVHAYGSRIRLVPDDNTDQNAIAPQRVVVRLTDGTEHATTITAIYGHPDAALTDAENLDKFSRNCSYARPPLSPAMQDRTIAFIEKLEEAEDVSQLPRLFVPPRA
ncbi:MAG TPA: MmgE/PrpD family protein [Hyphomicrobiaceae bacterium]